ncbi:hypothetical protein [Streptomyces flavidovirens]|uniref:hypothetical protein n=1 Tax=Streptomyces flavidovirens TaxID=67298 RepID=UPI0036D1E92A
MTSGKQCVDGRVLGPGECSNGRCWPSRIPAPLQTGPDVLITSLNRASRELDGVSFGGCGRVLATATKEETEMNHDDALRQLSYIAHERAFGRHVGSDRLIQVGLDALMDGIVSPSLAMLAGLVRSEEPEAPALFEQVLEELGLLFQPLADPRAAKWAMAYWIAGRIVDGSLDPATGQPSDLGRRRL